MLGRTFSPDEDQQGRENDRRDRGDGKLVAPHRRIDDELRDDEVAEVGE